MSEALQTPSDVLSSRQHAFLLQQLATAPDGTLTQSAANKAIPKQIAAELGLSTKAANDLRGKMVVAGWLTSEKVNRVFTYVITEEGRKQLGKLEHVLPLFPVNGKVKPPADDRTRIAREAFVVDSLFRPEGHTFTKAAAAALGKPERLGLNPTTIRAVLTDLALRGDVHVHRTADSESYFLTPTGTALRERLRNECPVLPPSGIPALAPSEAIRHGRDAFVLLRLLQCAKYTLWGSDAATGSYPKPLKMNHATAWKVRDELAQKGHIAIHWDGKEGCYTLTLAGKRYLATLPFDSLGEVKIKGSALTELLAAAHEVAKPATGETSTRVPPHTPQSTLSAEQLEATVMDVFDELLRGHYANLRMVPIHEIRSEVTKRFGPISISHADFNELLLDLRRTNRVRLISIDDRSRATSEQLRDSVFAVGETFFYMEKVNAFA